MITAVLCTACVGTDKSLGLYPPLNTAATQSSEEEESRGLTRGREGGREGGRRRFRITIWL